MFRLYNLANPISAGQTEMPEPKRPLKVFLCHAHADRDPVPQGDDMRGLYSRLTQDGVDCFAWFDKAKLLPGQDWELEIRKAVRE
jgi:hypothetical protein